MKALLIDTKAKEVKEIEYNNKLKELYKIIGCQMVDVGFYIGNDCCYVDDEGLDMQTRKFFYDGNQYMGNGVIVGTTKDGGNCEPELTLAQAKELISFPVFIHQKWAETLFEEKGISLETELHNGITISQVLDFLGENPTDVQTAVRDMLIKIDFNNGDVLDYMVYLARGMSQLQA